MFLLLCTIAVATVSCFKVSDYDVASEGAQPTQLKYSINLSLGANFGIIGHMHLESVPTNSGVKVYGWIEKNLANDKSSSLGEDAGQVREYQLDRGFALNDSTDNYNGFTLPLRLQHLATTRIEQIMEIQQLATQIEHEKQKLFAIATALYKNFYKMNLAKDKDYQLSGLAEQSNLNFAGKRFSKDLAAIKSKIKERRGDLTKIDYDTKHLSVSYSNYSTNTPALAYDIFSNAAALRQLHTGEQVAQITPTFNARGDVRTQRNYFESVLTQIVVIRQAELQLASALCAIYEPLKTNYYFSMGGVQEHLRLTMTSEDDGNNSFVRYKIKARNQNNKEFDFGYTDHDSSGSAISMRLNLKPLGGAKRFSKLDLTLE